jgi:hypothetical protein
MTSVYACNEAWINFQKCNQFTDKKIAKLNKPGKKAVVVGLYLVFHIRTERYVDLFASQFRKQCGEQRENESRNATNCRDKPQRACQTWDVLSDISDVVNSQTDRCEKGFQVGAILIEGWSVLTYVYIEDEVYAVIVKNSTWWSLVMAPSDFGVGHAGFTQVFSYSVSSWCKQSRTYYSLVQAI